MKIIFLGPPGSGKGTYSTRVAKKLDIPHISTGDLFRAEMKAQTELGKRAKEFIDKGELVPDEVTIGMLKNRIEKEDCKDGFILDGFPRTIPQAEALDQITEIDRVVNIDIPDEVIIRRLTSRRVCRKCGEIYNALTMKPKEEGKCDKCGSELYQRDDDTEETVKNRLKIYMDQTEPLIGYYDEKGLLVNIRWDKGLIPEGEMDIPIDVMLDKMMESLQ